MTDKFQINTPTLTNVEINITLTYRVKIEGTLMSALKQNF